MKVRLSPPRSASDQTRARMVAEFAAAGIDANIAGEVGAKGATPGVEVSPWFEFALAVAVGGIAWDIEKAAFRQALQVSGRLLAGRGNSVAKVTSPSAAPVEYFVPDGEESDRALDAIDADYERIPPAGRRLWWPGFGWLDEREVHGRLEAGQAALDSARDDDAKD